MSRELRGRQTTGVPVGRVPSQRPAWGSPAGGPASAPVVILNAQTATGGPGAGMDGSEDEEATQEPQEAPPGRAGKQAGKADCMWCQYGKPAAAGAAAGGVLFWLIGAAPASGALFGGASGLFYGWMSDE